MILWWYILKKYRNFDDIKVLNYYCCYCFPKQSHLFKVLHNFTCWFPVTANTGEVLQLHKTSVECMDHTGRLICENGAICIPGKQGSFKCVCNEGYVGPTCAYSKSLPITVKYILLNWTLNKEKNEK